MVIIFMAYFLSSLKKTSHKKKYFPQRILIKTLMLHSKNLPNASQNEA